MTFNRRLKELLEVYSLKWSLICLDTFFNFRNIIVKKK